MDGVIEVESGYAGGHSANPTYRSVCGGGTGHAEVVRVQFDPTRVSYQKLLDLFFNMHDASYSRGSDSQYRSIIIAASPQQEKRAHDYVEQVNANRNPNRHLKTQIVPSMPFFRAEEYHQRYYEKMGIASCRIR